MTRKELIKRIKETAYLEGDFVLRSGKRSKYYLDKYLVETCPDILKALGKEFASRVSDDVTLIAGAELGGVALAAATAMECGKKWVIIRNSKKSYGTGKLGGYFPPIEAWMSMEPDPKTEEVTEINLKQHSRTTAQFTNYPILTPDDLIVELKPNRYWKVVAVSYTEKNRTIVLQFPQLSAVNLSDIEYAVPVPEDRRRVMVSQHEAREKEREF